MQAHLNKSPAESRDLQFAYLELRDALCRPALLRPGCASLLPYISVPQTLPMCVNQFNLFCKIS